MDLPQVVRSLPQVIPQYARKFPGVHVAHKNECINGKRVAVISIIYQCPRGHDVFQYYENRVKQISEDPQVSRKTRRAKELTGYSRHFVISRRRYEQLKPYLRESDDAEQAMLNKVSLLTFCCLLMILMVSASIAKEQP